jgi:hypothetical protein
MIFEHDSKVIVDVIHNLSIYLTELGSIISNIKSLIHVASNFEIKFIRRQTMVAISLEMSKNTSTNFLHLA